MKKRIFAFNLIISAGVILITVALAGIFLYVHNINSLKKSIVSEASHIKISLESLDLSYLEKITPKTGHRITLISESGDVLFDSEVIPSLQDNHKERKEVLEVFEDGIGEALRFSNTTSHKMLYYAVRLENQNILRVSANSPLYISSVLSFWWVILVMAVISAVISWFLADVLTKKLVQPINNFNFEKPDSSPLFSELSSFSLKLKSEKVLTANKLKVFKQKNAEFSAITEYMREGFLILDKQAMILSHNKSALYLLNSDFSDAAGKSIWAINRNKLFTDAVSEALHGKPQEFIMEIGETHCQIFANPVWYKNSSHGVVVVILDVTEKQARERFRREFTANVSHELRTPLTSISGYAEIISNGVAKPEDTPKFAANIYKEAQRMIALIGDILFLSKLDENHSTLVKEEVNLYSVCQDIVARVKHKADKKNICINFYGENAVIFGIPAVLDEIMFNIIDNAVKYNKENGKIDISLKNKNRNIIFSVSDTGVGIPATEQDRVFERFYRIDKSRESSAQSTGLGLSIVKHGAALHGAKITLKSDGKTGTSISVIFPLKNG